MQVDDVFSQQHHGENFPVPFDTLKANINFMKLKGGDNIDLCHFKIKTLQLNHPGIDLGYRFESPNGVFIFLTDLADIKDNILGMNMSEKAKSDPKKYENDYNEKLLQFVTGADIIMHDTNFTEEEIKDKRHWGHSSPDDAINLINKIENKKPSLILSHHDPFHTDKDMDEIYKITKEKAKNSESMFK